MKIVIIGASAGVGLECVKRALERGHEVVTLSRSTNNLPSDTKLNAVKGNATNAEDLKKVLADADVCLVALGTGNSTKATTLYSDFAKSLIAAQKDLQTKIPFIILTGFGAGESGKYHGFLMKIVFSTILKAVYQNKTEMEKLIAESDLNWQFVRPGVLTNKPLTENYGVVADYYKGMKVGSVSRADVADFMVKQAENPSFMKKSPALSVKIN